MRKAIVGFLVGVALTGLAFVLTIEQFERRPAKIIRSGSVRPATDPNETVQEARSSYESVRDDGRKEEAPEPPPPSEGAANYMEIARGLTRDELRDFLSSLTLEQVQELRSQTREAARLMTLADAEIERRSRVETLADEGPATFPITLPPEFNSWLSEEPDPAH